MTKKSSGLKVQERLAAREFTSGTADAASLDARLAQAEANRERETALRKSHAVDQLQHAAQVLESQETKRAAAKAALESRVAAADARRTEFLEDQLRFCQTRASAVEAALSRKKDRLSEASSAMYMAEEEASARRIEHLTSLVEKVTRHHDVVKTKSSRVASARRIQGWFRETSFVTEAVSKLTSSSCLTEILGLVTKLQTTSSFDEAMDSLTVPTINKAAKELLSILPKSATLSARPARLQTPRVFLMACMIAYHSESVLDGLEEMAEQQLSAEDVARQAALSSNLLRASKALVRDLVTLGDLIEEDEDESVSLTTTLGVFRRMDASRTMYMDAFNAWKQMDGERMSGDLISMYAQLYSSNYLTHLTHGGNVKEDRVHEIMMRTKAQLATLRNSIYKVLGKEATDVRLKQLIENCRIRVRAKFEEQQKEDSKAEELAAERAEKQERAAQKAAATPDLGFAKNVFSNEALAHKLILDPAYQLEAPSEADKDNLMSRVSVQMKKAFWNSMLEDIKNSNESGASRLLSQLEEVRDAVLSVLGPTTKDAQEIKTLLDSSILRQAVGLDGSTTTTAAVVVNWVKVCRVFNFLLEKIVTNEAPARTESTAEWIEKLKAFSSTNNVSADEAASVLPPLVEFIVEKVDFLRLDSVNAHLRILAPYLARHGVEHEKTKFNEKLAADAHALDNTSRWIEHELLGRYVPNVSPSVRRDLDSGNASAFSCFLREAFVSLLETHIEGAKPELFPETFVLDVEYIRELRNSIDTMTLQASFVVLVKQALAKQKSPPTVFTDTDALELCSKISVLLSDGTSKLPDIAAQVVEEAKNKGLEADAATALHGQVSGIMEPGNVVFKLFFNRGMTYVVRRLASNFKKEEAEVTIPAGLEAFEKTLEEVYEKSNRLVKHNEAVYAAHYNKLIKAALGKSGSNLD